MENPSERTLAKTSEDLTIYKIIYSEFSKESKSVRKALKILARPAGLEPATPCLEVHSAIFPPFAVNSARALPFVESW